MSLEAGTRILPDLTGERFGELLVERESSTRPHGERAGRAWLCRCDCGRPAIRTTAQLRRGRKLGQGACCRECGIELWLGSRIAARKSKIERLRGRYKKYGYLYSHADEWRMRGALRREMANALGIDEPTRIDWHAALPAAATSVATSARRPLTLEPRRELALWRSAVDHVRRWLRWQTAVDLAEATYMAGLPRPLIERTLRAAYFDLREQE